MWSMILRIFTNPVRVLLLGLILFILISFNLYYKLNSVKNYYIELQAKQEKAFRELEAKRHEEILNAIKGASERQAKIELDSRAADAANDSLRKTIRTLNYQVSKLSKDASIKYSTTLSKLFRECTTRYKNLAEKADKHISDIKTMKQIFNKIEKVQK